MMKKSILMSLMLLAFGAAYGAEGDTAKTEPSVPQGPTLEEQVGNVKGSVESLTENYLETKTTVDKLAKIKLSGYVQAQWQYADSMGIRTIAGGNFPVNSQQRFQVRRGRLKTTYETTTSRYVLQFDVIPSGLSIKDAYATIMEPWLKTFSYTMGIFDRPFGFEIGYSSSSRESPERSRVYQTLFPGERDMGAKLEINPTPEMGPLQYLNLKGGVFTGMGPTSNEIDNVQDFIGRVGFNAPFYDLNLAIDGGFSAYLGGVTNTHDSAFSVGTLANGSTGFIVNTGNKMKAFDRTIMGVDGQIYYDLPVLGGFSLRGEYLWGKVPTYSSPGTANGNTFHYAGTPSRNVDNVTTATAPGIAVGAPSALPLYEREVMGWYVNYVQNLGTLFQAMVKYDVFDPNTKAEGSDIGKSGTGLNATDIMISTLGLGGIYHWDETVKFVAYYDMVTNEDAAFTSGTNMAWNRDLSDNVFTFRMQAKF
ncbi:MAG: hypothetical protein M3Y08_16285 [Fibrobacterota bacterium]|nr:hypothetical protein [Fibrobacterota bacterium]